MNIWPKEREPELAAMREAGTSIKEIAELAGVSKQVASYHLLDVEPVTELIDTLPDYPREVVRIPEGPCAITADWHAPYFSMRWVRRLLAVCLRLEVTRLAIVGDLTDLSWIAKYARKETRGSLGHDVTVILNLLRMLLDFYDEVYWCYGNHEDRLINALGGQDMLPQIGRFVAELMGGKLTVTDMRTMELGETWRLEHPKTFSRDAAKVAAAAAAIFHKNVACGHAHHIGFKHDVSGMYLGIDLGGMFDETRQEYLFKSGLVPLPAWNPGFWVYINGKMRPFEDGLINWQEWDVE